MFSCIIRSRSICCNASPPYNLIHFCDLVHNWSTTLHSLSNDILSHSDVCCYVLYYLRLMCTIVDLNMHQLPPALTPMLIQLELRHFISSLWRFSCVWNAKKCSMQVHLLQDSRNRATVKLFRHIQTFIPICRSRHLSGDECLDAGACQTTKSHW